MGHPKVKWSMVIIIINIVIIISFIIGELLVELALIAEIFTAVL
jgi:hypothetical protein